jgi:hypothetical protein
MQPRPRHQCGQPLQLTLDAWPAFDVPADALMAGGGPVVVAAPDPGGVKRALRWREHLQARWQHAVGFAMVDKRRVGGLVTSGQLVAGNVDGATVLLLDDIVASGGTLVHAAAALHHAGAATVQGSAAHGLFIDDADRALTASHLARLVVSDSVPLAQLGRLRLTAGGGLGRAPAGASHRRSASARALSASRSRTSAPPASLTGPVRPTSSDG